MADATTFSVGIDKHKLLQHSMELSLDFLSFFDSFQLPFNFTSVNSPFVSVVVVQGFKRVESRIFCSSFSEATFG